MAGGPVRKYDVHLCCKYARTASHSMHSWRLSLFVVSGIPVCCATSVLVKARSSSPRTPRPNASILLLCPFCQERTNQIAGARPSIALSMCGDTTPVGHQDQTKACLLAFEVTMLSLARIRRHRRSKSAPHGLVLTCFPRHALINGLASQQCLALPIHRSFFEDFSRLTNACSMVSPLPAQAPSHLFVRCTSRSIVCELQTGRKGKGACDYLCMLQPKATSDQCESRCCLMSLLSRLHCTCRDVTLAG
ncbi:hypothetical protein BCV69DRAFT_112022 [Microstroma glucosiphilum]|uniref:Uncharacterized protein n=1 Tax=Pseudomicrostroma glucosiphilum TaxID=1684307 RepID=A0A316UD90_9BASI|nr:hypothetical protein BCV69DRAFT_112022 [Pseudomicrostroma glucosiphilum]PWN23207.1 hypothetical protein BCV69DRAFT_112022 [Pseudomicrostroma glucosiphilum]